MQLVGEGDARAFEVIFDRHAPVAWALAYRVCGRRPLAEDVVQEAFLSLWRCGARYDPTRGNVRAWLLSVVRHQAIDAIRRASVRESHSAPDEELVERVASAELTEAEIVRRDDARHVHRALAALPPEQRQVIGLAYFGGLTQQEIARTLELPPGTVKGRTRLGLQKLEVVLHPTLRAGPTLAGALA
jgi:RNA polymerase sigma-70 factor, ECF subfamily